MFSTTHSSRQARAAGFSLVELLTVLVIISILTLLASYSISGTKGARDLGNAAYSVQGALEQARTYAMAENTYTWVGFFEENPSAPGTAGTGQIAICIVASANGMNIATANTTPQMPGGSLIEVSKITKVANVHLDTAVPTSSVTRPAVATGSASDTYELGSSDFPDTASSNSYSFTFPLGAATASAQYTFKQIIQFSPQGDATRIADSNTPTQMEIGLQPAHGSTITTTGANYAVLQVAGIGGQVITYRP
jgi:prepilin-type N-terminal cleavage/methylation domain-containing protein